MDSHIVRLRYANVCQVMCNIVIKGFDVIVHSPLVYDVRESIYKAYIFFSNSCLNLKIIASLQSLS
jgi:hypothetical protein